MAIQIKRIYDAFDKSDGARFLIDRLWPRGVSKADARLDGWFKALAPSSELRAWFGHKAENFARFVELYRAELDASAEAQKIITALIFKNEQGALTLLYGAKDPEINHAAVLKRYLEEKSKGA